MSLVPHDKKTIKAVNQEAETKGLQIRALNMPYTCTSVETCNGDLSLLEKSMETMNTRKRSRHVGKMLLSDGETLAAVAYVPIDDHIESEDDKKNFVRISAREWLNTVLNDVLASYGGGGAEGTVTVTEGSNEVLAFGTVTGPGQFAIKDRDIAQRASFTYLNANNVFPAREGKDDDDSSSSEFILGDEELGNL